MSVANLMLPKGRKTRFPGTAMRTQYIGIMLLFVSATVAQTEPPETLYKKAETAYAQGDKQTAITLYRKILQLKPDFVPVLTNLGVALAHEGDYRGAIDEYRKALQHDPGNPTVSLNLAIAWYKLADFGKAATELEHFRKLNPGNSQSLYLLADCYLRLGRNRDVVFLLDPVYAAHPEDLVVDYALGTALIRDGQTQKGSMVIDHVLRGGGSVVANLLLGQAQFAAGDFRTAASTIRKALDVDPSLPDAWSLYGQVLLESGDLSGAKQAFARAIRADPNDFDSNLHLGAALRHEGNNTEAAPYLNRALQLRPASPEALFQVGALEMATGHLGEARETFERLERQWPDFQEVHVQLATLYAQMNRKEDSRRERDIVVKLNESARQKRPQPEPRNTARTP